MSSPKHYVERPGKTKQQKPPAMKRDDTVYVWCDGSCNNKNHKNGGYGIFMKYRGHERQWTFGQFVNTTSARMEIRGVLHSLQLILNKGMRVEVYCDNQYVCFSISNGWAEQWELQNFAGRKNADLWKQILLEVRKFPIGYVQLRWIKGHTLHYNENDTADKLAGNGAKYKELIDDTEIILSDFQVIK